MAAKNHNRVWTSPGELCTLKAIGKYGKPWLDVDSRRPLAAEEVAAWILISGVRTLNVAGNSEKTSPGIFKEAYVYLGKVFRAIAIAKMRE